MSHPTNNPLMIVLNHYCIITNFMFLFVLKLKPGILPLLAKTKETSQSVLIFFFFKAALINFPADLNAPLYKTDMTVGFTQLFSFSHLSPHSYVSLTLSPVSCLSSHFLFLFCLFSLRCITLWPLLSGPFKCVLCIFFHFMACILSQAKLMLFLWAAVCT